jgi:hypothetical protein
MGIWTKQNMPSFSPDIEGAPTEGLWTPTVDQKHRIGARYQDGHGRIWRYSLNGAAILAAGYMAGKEAINGDVQDITQTAYGDVAIGDTRVTVLVTTTNGILDGELLDGTLLVQDSTGYLHAYAIAGNTYISGDTVMSVELYDPIRVAWAATTVISLTKNPYLDVVVMGTTPTGHPVGVPNVTIPIAYYGWLQRKGYCAMYADTGTTLVIGVPAGNPTSATTPGSVEAPGAAEPWYGNCVEIGAQTKGCIIDLNLE